MMGRRVMWASVFAMVCSLVPAALATGPELSAGTVRVAMSSVDGHILVPLRIDGEGPFLFQIDTGSPVSLLLAPALAERLGIAADGLTDASAPTTIGRLEIGGATFRDMPAVTGEVPARVQGVLGFSFFHDVLLTIDYAAGAIELQLGSLSGEGEGVVPLVGPSLTPQVAMQVGDQVYIARIDTGLADNVVLPLSAAAELATESAPAAMGEVQADGRTLEARVARLSQPLLVAGRRYERLPVVFADVQSGPRVGYGLLAYFTLTFDQTAGLVRISAPAQAQLPTTG